MLLKSPINDVFCTIFTKPCGLVRLASAGSNCLIFTHRTAFVTYFNPPPMNRYFLPLFLCCLFFAPVVRGQRTLTGKVTGFDNRNQPLPNVVVTAEGSPSSTRTNAEGRFTLNVPPATRRLWFALPGYDSTYLDLVPGVNDYPNILMHRAAEPPRPAPVTPDSPIPPVDTIPVAWLATTFGQTDLAQILAFSAPLFHSNRASLAGASDHVDAVQLRGMASDQMLVLVNGRRWHHSALVHTGPTAQRGMAQGVDWNMIPASAVERVEVMRDVVAGQYGSDATAGVVNIVLKNRPGVVDAQVSYGQRLTRYDKNLAFWKFGTTDRPDVGANDGQTLDASLRYGFALGERGTLNLSGVYQSRGSTSRAGAYTGKIFPVQYPDTAELDRRNLTRADFDMQMGEARMRGGGGIFDLALDLTDHWKLLGSGSFFQKKGRSAGYYWLPYTIESEAGFVGDDFVFPTLPNGFLPEINADNRDLGASLGLNGRWGDWSLDLSNTLGQNRLDLDLDQSVNYTERENNAGPPQTSFDAGGLSLFQNTAQLELARRFAPVLSGLRLTLGLEHRLERFAVRTGEPLSWEYYDGLSLAVPGGPRGLAGFSDTSGAHRRNGLGVYLSADQRFTPALTLRATGRFDRWSAGLGKALTGKLLLLYRPGEQFSLFASAGTGFRAPSIQQQFYAQNLLEGVRDVAGGVFTGQSGIFSTTDAATRLFETGGLSLEKNLGFALGLTVRPVSALRLTVDAWHVTVRDRVVLTNGLYKGNGSDTLLNQALTQGSLWSVRFWDNALTTRTFGIQAGVAWSQSFDERQTLGFDLNGVFCRTQVAADENDVPDIDAADVVVLTEQSGQYFNREDRNRLESALPRLKMVAGLRYDLGPFGAALRATWFGATRYRDADGLVVNNEFNDRANEALDQDFSGKAVLDLSLSYAVVGGVRLGLGAHNLLDVYPDSHSHFANTDEGRRVYNTTASPFGFAGRYLFARLKIEL